MPRRKEHGSITGSKSFRKSKSVGDAVAGGIKATIDNLTQKADDMVSSAEMTPEQAQQQEQADAKAPGKAPNPQPRDSKQPGKPGGSGSSSTSSLSNLASASAVQHGIIIPKFDVNSMVGGDLYSPASGIPETGILEATKTRGILARQSNSLDIAADKVALTRKAVKVATDIRHLEGDSVDYDTAGVQTATKVVRNKEARTDYAIADSKLEMKNEQLVHQQIATEGTKALTPLIREEWNLKVLAHQSSNDLLKLDIEKGKAEITRKENELELKIMQATIM